MPPGAEATAYLVTVVQSYASFPDVFFDNATKAVVLRGVLAAVQLDELAIVKSSFEFVPPPAPKPLLPPPPPALPPLPPSQPPNATASSPPPLVPPPLSPPPTPPIPLCNLEDKRLTRVTYTLVTEIEATSKTLLSLDSTSSTAWKELIPEIVRNVANKNSCYVGQELKKDASSVLLRRRHLLCLLRPSCRSYPHSTTRRLPYRTRCQLR